VPNFDDAVEQLCVLEDPVRRAAYLAVRAAPQPVTRADVASAIDISPRLATFHLEKLLESGYLEASFTPRGKGGGVGHPAKRYRAAKIDLDVSIPPRRYDLAAAIFADALRHGTGADAPLAVVAEHYGRRLGARVDTRADGPRYLRALRDADYEPVVIDDDAVVLRNCPFRTVAQAQPDVVCRMNQAFVAGLLAGARARSRISVLDPEPGRCCVVVTQRRRESESASTARLARADSSRSAPGTRSLR
jgi:predicted ArsR family transcriptional regulator